MNLSKKQYIQKLNKIFDRKTSFADTLTEFSQISKDYEELNNDIVFKKYSSPDFDKCTHEEQEDFINEQAQFIECLVINSVYDHQGMVWGWHEIFYFMRDPEYAKTPKINRRMMFTKSDTIRPTGDNAFDTWNGFQVIDLDIKDEKLAKALKPILFKELCQHHWFLGICLSASGNSLHVWTKIKPIGDTFEHKKTEYYCNFRHKYSYIYTVLYSHMEELGYTKEDILNKWLDMAMAKPQQGSFISSDFNAIMNTNFTDARLDVNFETAYISGVSSINWISHPDLKEIFSKLNWFGESSEDSSINLNDIEKADMNVNITNPRHYKHIHRWQLANTLTSLYGPDKALSILTKICKGTPYPELAGDVKTASIHNKPISKWAVQELNRQHGFNIKVKVTEDKTSELIDKIENAINTDNTIDPIKILNDNVDTVRLHLNADQYLSHIKDDIIANLGHITLLEAGAGYGKTEMIKSLSAKTLLIMPFVSTIKSKVEASEVTKDWLMFHSGKKPSLADLLGNNNMTMTIDKFASLNVYELNQANFKYIVIDESHLLFTSKFRQVMSPCIQRLANCKAKVIMMSGTPTGELLFFPNIRHIKVNKDDNRIKKFTTHFVPRDIEKTYEITCAIAKDIIDGRKVLFPTNKGNLFFEQMTGMIQQIITEKFKSPHSLKAFYYKKSNTGNEYMDSINIDKSIGDNDIIFCTSYLSVGVDICDRYRFSVYFDEFFMPQEIEQFANRLRNNNLYIHLYAETEDAAGLPIDYTKIQKLDLGLDDNEVIFVHDMAQMCNDVIWRNKEESKHNSFVAAALNGAKYFKYDENDCQYYIDETGYKLILFEDRYSEYVKQLPVIQESMRYYGYDIEIVKHTQRISDDMIIDIDAYFKSCRNKRYNYTTTQTLLLLDHITDDNIDMYKDLLRGSYEIFKDDKFEVDRLENNLYCNDIEIMEKNIPIVLGLYKFYDCDTIKEIFQYCIESKQNRINYSKLNRIRKFVNIEYNRKKKRLDFPVLHFMSQARAWANENPVTTVEEISKWQGYYAIKYANSIPNVVVDDVKFLEEIYDIVKELWNVIIIQSRPKKGNVTLKPFELLWTRKTSMNDIYGGSKYTKEFFLQELINNMSDNIEETEEEEQDEEINVTEDLQLTHKLKFTDIQSEIPNIIHSTFDYNIYSKEDNSNNRFMRKQFNTNILRENMYGNTAYEDIKESDNKTELDLFNERS